jgi:hypothetical protein
MIVLHVVHINIFTSILLFCATEVQHSSAAAVQQLCNSSTTEVQQRCNSSATAAQQHYYSRAVVQQHFCVQQQYNSCATAVQLVCALSAPETVTRPPDVFQLTLPYL